MKVEELLVVFDFTADLGHPRPSKNCVNHNLRPRMFVKGGSIFFFGCFGLFSFLMKWGCIQCPVTGAGRKNHPITQINKHSFMGISDAAAKNNAVRHPQSEPGLPLHHPECNGRAPVKPTSLDDQRIDPAR